MTPRVTGILVVFGVAGALCLPAALGQTTGAGTGTGTVGGSTGTGAGRGTITTNPGTVPSNTIPSTGTGTQPPPVAMPVYLTGKVTLEDGSPPPDLVTIERVCNAVTHNAGYADAHGNFSIELGNEQGVFQDATDGVGAGTRGGGGSAGRTTTATERMLQNCELRGKLTGYRSQSIMLAGRRVMDDPNVGTILLHKEGPSEGNMVSATSLNAPKSAQRLYDKGVELAKKEKFGDAIASFQKAIEAYPAYAAAWTELGRVMVAGGQIAEGRFAFESAIKLDPKFVNPYLELSLVAYTAQQWPELSGLTARAMRLDPFDFPQLFLLNGVAHYELRETDAAERSVKEAERLDTQHRFPETAHLHGLIFAQRGEYATACDLLRTYLKTVPNADDAGTVRGQLAQYEKARATTSAAKQ